MRIASIGKRGGWLWAICLMFLLGCEDPQPNPPVPPETEDPILQVSVPGAYGIPGGNQVYNEDRHQLSAMECPDGTLLFRILDPGERKVLSLHGIPGNLTKGERISIHFCVMVNGYTIQSETFTDLLVLKTASDKIWLKKDDTTYFVLQR